MKLKAIMVAMLVAGMTLFSACGAEKPNETKSNETYAYVDLGSTTIKVEVSTWGYVGYGSIRLRTTDGKMYISSNITIVQE